MLFMQGDADESNRMRTDLNHLPEPKQRELAEIVRLIRAQAEVLHIILYGSYARGDWKEAKDLKPNRWSGHASDYDILVIVETEEQARDLAFWNRLERECNRQGFSARVSLIVHDLADVNANLEEGRYFFVDVKREGRLLYGTEGFDLAEPRDLTPEEEQCIAQADFDNWFERAKEFYENYEFNYGKGKLRPAIFNLNLSCPG